MPHRTAFNFNFDVYLYPVICDVFLFVLVDSQEGDLIRRLGYISPH